MLMGYWVVVVVMPATAMVVRSVLVMVVFTMRHSACKRIWRVFLLNNVLRTVHQCDSALIGQYKTQDHAEHDG